MAVSTEITRRKFFDEGWTWARRLGTAYAAYKLGGFDFLLPKKVEADDSDFLSDLPEGSKPTINPGVFTGEFTKDLKDKFNSLRQTYQSAGISDYDSFGIIKTVFYLQTSWGYYPVINTERMNLSPNEAELKESLLMPNILNLSMQCDSKGEKIFPLPSPAKERLRARKIGGNESPTFFNMRNKMTLGGAENYDNKMVSQAALKKIDEKGNLGSMTAQVFDPERIIITKFENGHNVTRGADEYIKKIAGVHALRMFGLPVCDPYWIEDNITGEKKWVLWQAFQRRTVTYTPQNPAEYRWQSGLAGSAITDALYGNENPPSPDLGFLEKNRAEIVYPLIFSNGDRSKPLIALTMDDAWDRNNVKKVLDICAEKGIKMTFFPVGTVIGDEKELWRRADNEGHELGFHTWSHDNLLPLSKNAILANLQRNQDALDYALGYHYPTRFMRPPGGNGGYNGGSRNVLDAAAAGGYSIAMWSIDPLKEPNSSAFYNHVVSRARNGDVILTHFNQKDIGALPSIIDTLLNRGLTPTTLSGLFA